MTAVDERRVTTVPPPADARGRMAVTADGSTSGDADRLRAGLDQVRRLGVTGVPVFFFDGVRPLVGSQPESALFAALSEAADSTPGI